MKARQIHSLVVCLLSVLIVNGCQNNQTRSGPGGSDRVIHISAVPNGGSGCEVDYPVTFVRNPGNNNNPHIKWHSDDNDYSIEFVRYTNGPNDNPPNVPGPNPENPFDPSTNSVPVKGTKDSGNMKISSNASGYYKYRIRDAHGNTCKEYTDDQDTGVNVKR